MAGDGFQDNVKYLTNGVLEVDGNAVQVGDGAAGAKSINFTNGFELDLAANPTANRTIFLPDGAGTLMTNLNVSAGTTSNNLTAVVFSNSNNVSFGLNGSTVTASATVASTQASINVSAGTTSNNLSAITFSNSNGVSFGLNGSTLTGSIATSLTNVNLSAGTTSQNLSAFVFSNSNNVSFGLNGSTVTASATVASTQASINFSGGTTSNNLSAITFSNSNGISFGLNGSTMTGSVATSLTNVNLSAGTTSNNLSAMVFSNSNGVSFGLNGSTVTGSVATSLTNINVSAGTTSQNLSAVVFSNSNGVSFGLNGSTVTASAAGGGGAAISAGTQSGNTGTIIFSNSNGVTFGMSNSSIVTASIATSLTNVNLSAGTTSQNLSAFVFSNSNNVSFGLNGSTVTATITTPAETPFGISAGTQSVSTGTLVFSNSNNVSFGMSGSSRVTASIQPGVSAIADGNGSTVTSGVVVFSNVGGNINFGLNGSTMTAQADTPAISAGTQSQNINTIVFSNSNGISFGMTNSSRITASADYVRSISAGTTNATGNQIVFSNLNGISFGANGATITASLALATAWSLGMLANSPPAQIFEIPAFSSGGTSNLSFQRFSAPNQISATQMDMLLSMASPGASAGSYTISLALYTFAGSTASSVSSTSSQFTFNSSSNDVSSAIGGNTDFRWRTVGLGTWNITPGEYLLGAMISGSSGASGSWTAAGPGQASNVASDINILAFNGGNYSKYFDDGIYSAGTGAFPSSVHLSAINQTGAITAAGSFMPLQQPYFRFIGTGSSSGTAGGGLVAIGAISAGTTSASSGTVVFSNSNNVSFGMNASTITGSAQVNVSAGTTSNNLSAVTFSNSNGISFGLNGSTVTAQGVNISYWENPQLVLNTSWSGTSNSISVQRLYVPNLMSATRADIVLNISGSSSGALSLRMNLGLYTANHSTLNSVSTTSRGLTFQSTSAVSYTNVSGPRSWSIGLGTWNLTPGEYFLAVNYGWTTASTNTAFIQMFGNASFPNVSGSETGALGNDTNYFRTAMINNNAQSTLPDTMQLSGMTMTGASRGLQPWVAFIGTF